METEYYIERRWHTKGVGVGGDFLLNGNGEKVQQWKSYKSLFEYFKRHHNMLKLYNYI